MPSNFPNLINDVVAALDASPQARFLLDPNATGDVNLNISAKVSGLDAMESAMGFEYPNTIHIRNVPVPDGNKDFKPRITLALIHELLHRKQAEQPALQPFFEGALRPMETLSAQLLIEAENHANTARMGWRLAQKEPKEFGALGEYMRHGAQKYPDESYNVAYAKAMEGKAITPETELHAMKECVRDFLFNHHRAQRYTLLRLNTVADYVENGTLQNRLNAQRTPVAARAWLKSQPALRGLGPDAATYDSAAFVKLGETPAGNMFDIQPKFMDHVANPGFALAFLNPEQRPRVAALQGVAEQLTDYLSTKAELERKKSGTAGESSPTATR